jgi:ubiquinone/menaquinone biosynthesis C-methylase UbiE
VQSRIEDLVLDELRWDGKGEALDIGCGNGPLAIAIAKAHPAAHVTGIDTWGAGWEYSRTVCERNAAIEGVSSRTSFQKASAAALPFDDAAFDVVVSNLVFHEVRAVKDKKLLLEEALRVLRPGGVFVFQDLFQWKRVYGDVEVLRAALEAWGVRSVSFRATNDSSFIPTPLKLPFMVGTIWILSGVK